MNKSLKNYTIFLVIVISITFSFLNFKMKLEKPDEDWSWENIINLHINNETRVETSSKSFLELNFLTSNNFFLLNYNILKLYNNTLDKINDFIDINKYGYTNFINNDLDIRKYNQEYYISEIFKYINLYNLPNIYKYEKFAGNNLPISEKYFEKKFEFGKGDYLFKENKFNLFYHYNYLYLNNIIIFFLLLIILINNKNIKTYNYIYPILVYFLTPQVNSLILFLNSDFLILMMAPLLCILINHKKYLPIILILFILQLFNRSNIILWVFLFHYIYFYNNIFELKTKNKIIIYLISISCLILLIIINIENYSALSVYNKSGLNFIIDMNLNLFFYELFKSISILSISTLYLNGQNSFILSNYDYLIFLLFIIFYSCLSLFLYRDKIFIISVIIFVNSFLFLNGFDQFRHHPFIYFSIILLFFNKKKEENTIIKHVNLMYVIFLIYTNIKVIHLQNILL